MQRRLPSLAHFTFYVFASRDAHDPSRPMMRFAFRYRNEFATTLPPRALELLAKITKTAAEHSAMKERFSFPVSEYPEVAARLKALRTATTDAKLREAYADVVSEWSCTVEEMPPRMHMGLSSYFDRNPVQRPLDARLMEAPPPPLVGGHDDLPNALWKQLYVTQRLGVQFVLNRRGRAIIADEMGVGKTHQGLAVVLYYRALWPAIVVAPSSLCEMWYELLKEWVGRSEFPRVAANAKLPRIAWIKDSKTLFGDVNVLTYDLCPRIAGRLGGLNAGVLVADESHMIKNADANRTAAVTTLAANAQVALMMSGTPATSRPIDLYTQLHLMEPLIFYDKHAFGVRYCGAKQEQFGWNYRGCTNKEELQNLLVQTCMIRRTKAQALAHLPPKTRERVYVEIKEDDAAELAKLKDDLKELRAVKSESKAAKLMADAKFMAYARKTAHAKIAGVKAHVTAWLLDPQNVGKKLVAFGHHQFMIEALCNGCTEAGEKCVVITGDTHKNMRQEYVRRFQETEDLRDPSYVRVAVLSIQAAGVGLTMTRAHDLVFGELTWTSAALEQAEDRVHRNGQTKPVRIEYVVCKEGCDDDMWRIVSTKLRNLSFLLDGKTRWMKETPSSGASAGPARSSQSAARAERVDLANEIYKR